ncbi:MAG: HNH endonuclease signature motif containing protein [Ruthenibacterium sp.]
MNFNFAKYLTDKSARNDFTDNDACRMAAYFVQDGKCYVTDEILQAGQREPHHRTPRWCGGKDVPENLILLNRIVHLMVHTRSATEFETLLARHPLTAQQLSMVNQLRIEAHEQLFAC